jgi:hypothetical protein
MAKNTEIVIVKLIGQQKSISGFVKFLEKSCTIIEMGEPRPNEPPRVGYHVFLTLTFPMDGEKV